jgi:uncharacterized protein
MQFIPCVETDSKTPEKAAPFSVSADDYGTFLCTLFDLWQADFQNGRPTTSIRYFESLFFTYVNQPPPECTLLDECGNYLVIEHNGDVFACDFFVEPAWRLGNVMTDSLTALLNSQKQNSFGRMKADLPAVCLDCPWLQHCRGGCTKDRLRDPQDRGVNHFCKAYQQFFRHADAAFKRLAEWWHRDQVRQKIQAAVKEGRLQVQRNDPCPCGSGKKYKKCCGRV